MGYRSLKAILKVKKISVRVLAEKTNINPNKIYESFCFKDFVPLSQKDKVTIYNWLVENSLTKIPFEEVFKVYVDNLYEFDTVYKSEAIGRSKRRSSH